MMMRNGWKGRRCSNCLNVGTVIGSEYSRKLHRGSRPQPLGVQSLQFRHDEPPVLANQPPVEPDLAAAVLGALDADHVPVDLALVAVAVHVVRLAGGEVE